MTTRNVDFTLPSTIKITSVFIWVNSSSVYLSLSAIVIYDEMAESICGKAVCCKNDLFWVYHEFDWGFKPQ